jgi:hypothetical protein
VRQIHRHRLFVEETKRGGGVDFWTVEGALRWAADK